MDIESTCWDKDNFIRKSSTWTSKKWILIVKIAFKIKMLFQAETELKKKS